MSQWFRCTQSGIGGLVLIAEVFNQFVSFGKHGIEESRRVKCVLTILKSNDYAVSRPQRLDQAGNRLIIFHLSIIDNQTQSNQFCIRHKSPKLGQLHYTRRHYVQNAGDAVSITSRIRATRLELIRLQPVVVNLAASILASRKMCG